MTYAPPVTPGLTVIQDVALVAPAASVTFPTIPQTFRNLVIAFVARGDAAANEVGFGFQFNGDTGATYDWMAVYTTGTGTPASAGLAPTTSLAIGTMTGSTAPAGDCAGGHLYIFRYKDTTFRKTAQSYVGDSAADNTGGLSYRFAYGNWHNTAAITQIVLVPSSGNFVAGSAFTLYGEL